MKKTTEIRKCKLGREARSRNKLAERSLNTVIKKAVAASFLLRGY